VNIFKVCDCGGRLGCIDSRNATAYDSKCFRRRYRCKKCGVRYTTVEFLVSKDTEVISGGYRQNPGEQHIDSLLSQGEQVARTKIREALGASIEKI
jgi:transcriptional regulator NrdR family protein